MSTVNPKVPYHSQRGIPCQSLLVSYPMLRVHHVRRCPAPGDGAELVSPSASALPLPCRRRNQAWKRPPCHDDPHIMGILRLYWRIMKARMVSCCKSMYNVLDFFWWCTWKISKYAEVKTPNSSKHYHQNSSPWQFLGAWLQHVSFYNQVSSCESQSCLQTQNPSIEIPHPWINQDDSCSFSHGFPLGTCSSTNCQLLVVGWLHPGFSP